MPAPAIPTTAELATSIVSQIELKISQTMPFLPRAFTRVLAKALAGQLVLLYKYDGFIFLQMFVAFASADETEINGRKVRPLVELGRLIGEGDPRFATPAELVVTATVTNQTGSLAAGSQVLYAPTGIVYLTKSAVQLNAPTVQATIRAASDQTGGQGAGAAGNLQPGAVLQFANPLPNVAPNVTVASVAVTGADAEDIETSYRPRVIGRFQARPQGGAYSDYRAWGEEAAGIIHIYPYRSDNPGEVDVYAEATEASSGSADGIPTSDQLQAVEDLINMTQEGLASRRPVCAAVNVYPITRTGFNVEIFALVAPDEVVAKNAIQTALDEHLRSLEPFIEGLSALPRRNDVSAAAIGGVAYEAASAVGASIGEVRVDPATQPRPLHDGEKAKLGTMTWS